MFISISTEIISSFQWNTWFAKLLPCSSFFFRSTHMHRISYLAYHTCFASCCLCISRDWLWFHLLVFLSWVEPGDEFVNEEPVEFAYEDQGNSEYFAGKMTIPSKSLLSLLASCSLFCYAYATMPTTWLSCLPNCHVKPLTHHCPSKPLIGYVTALLSPSYSVASCRWRLEFVPCWNMFIVGISLLCLVYY